MVCFDDWRLLTTGVLGPNLLNFRVMQVKSTYESKTKAVLTIIPSADELNAIKQHTLGHFQAKAKLPGFREGKAPLEVVEKNVDQNALQTEFLEEAINQLYPQAVESENLRPVSNPEINIKKFVPYTTLEVEAVVPVIGEIQLADYKKIKLKKPEVKVGTDDVKEVVKSLQHRLADKKEVERAAKLGDEVLMDFIGTDEKGIPVNGADGKDYPLSLGSNTFIPGFEDNLIGMKAGDTKKFTLTFPKDYGVQALANKKVTFEATLKKVEELTLPKADDNFAAKAGPFKTMSELKADIKKQLTLERERQAGLDYESELVREITAKSKIEVPEILVEGQIERMVTELKQNLVYRGQTYEEYLKMEEKSDEQFRKDVLWPQAEERVKGSLVLLEVADKEKLEVSPEELEIRMQTLKSQYQDASMQAELDKPETRREIAMRMLSEKTVAQLANYANKS